MNQKLSKLERVLGVVAIGFLILAYFLPLWTIELTAPQYPEGLGLTIWLNKMTGDINSINLLNHYIGMKAITASSIPELVIFPKVLIGIIVSGLLTLIINRRILLQIWFVVFLVLALMAFGDFYKWEYQYGHELSDDAPIKMPGMTYQPPLIGSKVLLNITAYSYPSWGGIFLTLALLLLIFAILPQRQRIIKRAAALFTILVFVACTSGPTQIEFGKDNCEVCRMSISDPRFGGEIILRKGKTFKFDSLNCISKFMSKNKDKIDKVYVLDYSNKGHFINAEKAFYLVSPQIHGPMGTTTFAASDKVEFLRIRDKVPGRIMEWNEMNQILGSQN